MQMQYYLESNIDSSFLDEAADDVEMADEGDAGPRGSFAVTQVTTHAQHLTCPSVTSSLERTYLNEANVAFRRLQEDIQDSKERIEVYKKTTSCLLSICECILDEGKSTAASVENEDDGQMMVEEWFDNASALIRVLVNERPFDAFFRWQETRKRIEEVYLTCTDRWSNRFEGQISEFMELSLNDDLFTLAESCLSGLLEPDNQYRRLLHSRGSQAQSLANLLYGASALSQDKRSRRRIEKALRKLCGRAGILPSAFYLGRNDLKRTSLSAVTCGGFADIYEGTFGGRKVAMKVLRVFSEDKLIKARESFYKEVIYWKELAHVNIVPFVGLADPDILPLCMVSEWMVYGNVLTYLKTFPRANRMNLISDIIAGLYYLHRLGIIHGDMKSGNVLIDHEFRARLGDFGLARVTQEPSTMSLMQTTNSVHGSVRWMAPELLEPSNDSHLPKLTPETDIYAMALVMLEAFTGRIPFYDQTLDAFVVLGVTRGLSPVRPSDALSKGLSDKVWDLMCECWQKDAVCRPRMEEIRARFEDERASFEVPEATSPEECEEVEDMLSAVASDDDDDMLIDGSESDLEYSFMQQDFTRPRADARQMVNPPVLASRDELDIEREGNRYQRPDWPRGPRPMPVLRKKDGIQSSVLEGC